MKALDDDFIQSGLINSEDNTWSGRYSSTIPNFSKQGAVIKIQGNGVEASITNYDEIALYLLVKYLFIPLWLVEQWYSTSEFDIIGMNVQDGRSKVRDWVKLNLCWLESDPTGIYLRPTKVLFSLFSLQMEAYSNLPTNTLTHTVSEISVCHEIMSGKHKLLKKFKTLPRQSMLGLSEQEDAANVIIESDFRNPGIWTEKGIQKTIEIERNIDEESRNGKIVTAELKDFRYFAIIKKVQETGVPKKDYRMHLPDIVIPMIRDKNGNPRSIAIETELTSKGVAGYRESIERYKDNNKFGVVVYMCGGPRVAESLKQAYRDVKGSGKTKFLLMDFKIPSPKFEF